MLANTCNRMRAIRDKHEWLRDFFGLAGISLMAATILTALYQHESILLWINQDFLIHGMAFLGITLVDVLLTFGLLCLAFSNCDSDDKNCLFAYRGRRSGVHPSTLNWMESIGRNPRRPRDL